MNIVTDGNTRRTSIDALETTQHIMLSEVVNNEDYIEAIVELIDLYIACIKLNCFEQNESIARIQFLINKWIELIGPVKYIPGLINELTKHIESKLWNTDLHYELLSRVFLKTYDFRKNTNVPSEEINEFRESASEVLTSLGYRGGSELIDNVINTDDPENLITLVVLSIVLSTNNGESIGTDSEGSLF